MKSKKSPSALPLPSFTPGAIGLDPDTYARALHYLFDRSVPSGSEEAWFWDLDEPRFDATPLEWTRIQTVLFANAGTDLTGYGDEQVGLGLTYVMSNSVSDVPFAAIHPSVPLDDAMRMMAAMPSLWRDGFGPRLASIHAPIGSGRGRLAYACYMWFDEWPTFSNVCKVAAWQDALWNVFEAMLKVPCRSVQIAALHGIGHQGRYLSRKSVIDRAVELFVKSLDGKDPELAAYADAARRGMVQ